VLRVGQSSRDGLGPPLLPLSLEGARPVGRIRRPDRLYEDVGLYNYSVEGATVTDP